MLEVRMCVMHPVGMIFRTSSNNNIPVPNNHAWTEKSINYDAEVFMQIRSDLIPHKYLQITQETTSVAT